MTVTDEDYAELSPVDCHCLNYWRWAHSERGQQDIRLVEWPGHRWVPDAPLRLEWLRWMVQTGRIVP